MDKVGVFSGTFDPVHIGHVEACLVSKAALELDTVCILLEKNPARKADVTDYKDRLAMLKLAVAEYGTINVLDFDEDNVTVESALDALDSKFANAKYWYILGSDMLKHIESWAGFEDLMSNFKLCVVLRNNSEKNSVTEHLNIFKESFPKMDYKILPEVWSEVSSSKVRQEIKETGTSKNVNPEVLEYIKNFELY